MTATTPRNRILVGDARTRLAGLPSASVDCVITSPPYYAQRDYGHRGQLGAEPDIESWVAQLRAVFAEVARVLAPHGVCWLNLGDGYSRHPREGAAKKSLLLGPERLALALTNDGWLLRNKVVWAKTNAMPCSVEDRFANRHEYLYMLTRQPRYYFDLHAVRVPASPGTTAPRRGQAVYPPLDAAPRRGAVSRIDLNHGLAALKADGRHAHPLGKNPGDVWTQASGHFRGAHFATFPLSLITRPLLSSCPQQVCTRCGRPWRATYQRRHGRLLATGHHRPTCPCPHPDDHTRNGLVLDPFIGSGTVAVAAEDHQRDWLGIELNPGYAALAEQRITAARDRRRTPKNAAPGGAGAAS